MDSKTKTSETTTSNLRSMLWSAARSVYSLRYYYFDVIKQRIFLKLSNKNTNHRVKILHDDQTRAGKFCIFVHYSNKPYVAPSNRRILDALHKKGISTLIVANHKVLDEQLAYFRTVAAVVMERTNIGADFGAYKDAISWLTSECEDPNRVALLNDSVFFIENGLDDFVDRLFGLTAETENADTIAAYENWGEGHHLQSFALSISQKVFESGVFQSFWKNYQPISNRVYAIEHGEKKLSAACIRASNSTSVIFGKTLLAKAFFGDENYHFSITTIAIMLRKDMKEKYLDYCSTSKKKAQHESAYFELKQTILDGIFTTSPIHSGAYFFPHYLQSPLFKKDLVFRQRFYFGDIESWGKALMTEDEYLEFMQILREKSDWKNLSALEKRKYAIGVR